MKYSQVLLKRAFAAIAVLFLTTQLSYADGLPDFVKLAKEVSPAVVNVSTLVKPKAVNNPFYGNQQQIPLPEIFRHFFEQPYPAQPKVPSKNEKPVPRSLGSGFILSKNGYILTNYHVVKGADEIIVRLKDRSEYKAKLIGDDPKTDLALLKIDAKDLPTVKLGDSQKLEPGQWVFAIGSPFGFNYSVTKGIVSALNRSLPNDSYVPFIQTDVPINPGNSGGPLVNMQGQVIGINSQIYTRSGGFMGVSFAIPIDEAAYVAKQLKEHGKVTRGWLGVIFQNVDQALAKSFGLEHPQGALVSQVVPDSPAAKAGFKPGDIILSCNGQKIEFFNDLPVVIGRTPVGSKIDTTVWRNGKKITIHATIEKKPDNADTNNSEFGLTEKNNMGIQVQTLNDQWRQNLDLQDGVSGVVVTKVSNSGIGADLGLMTGDVMTQIDNQQLKNVHDFNKVMKHISEKKGNINIAVRIIRQGVPLFKAFSFTGK